MNKTQEPRPGPYNTRNKTIKGKRLKPPNRRKSEGNIPQKFTMRPRYASEDVTLSSESLESFWVQYWYII